MKIKQAAIRDGEGVVHTLPRPARHHTIMHQFKVKLCEHSVEGFVLEDDTFVDRKTAGKLAVEAEQIEKLKWPPNLYSEDLW